VAFQTRDVDYLQVDGKTFQATIYQPEGPGPFPAILDVHGGAWVREDKRCDEHVLMDKALAAMGMVVVAIDYRQSDQHHYPGSVVNVNLAFGGFEPTPRCSSRPFIQWVVNDCKRVESSQLKAARLSVLR